MPRKWNDAVSKYSEDTLQAYGIVPWQIEIIYKRLVYAFIEKDADKILKYSADLGHYVADAHVPLHTTLNYDGQFTGQKGIHAFWESRLPELFSENYDYLVGTAQYEYSVLDFAWETVESSNNAIDSVLSFDKILSETYEKDKQLLNEYLLLLLIRLRS